MVVEFEEMVMGSYPDAMLDSSSVVASADSYAEAQETVDYLWTCGLRGGLQVLGAGLRMVDRPGRESQLRVAGAAAGQGAGIGFIAAVLVAFFAQTSTPGVILVLWGVFYGGLFGGLRGLFQGLVRSRPGQVSPQVVATRYEVYCAARDASVARQLLAQRAESTEGEPTTVEVTQADEREAYNDAERRAKSETANRRISDAA
ncbi:hypothetical protein [Kribbella deserti]|uniref:Uncharacterized protein n=1 Tax=Kribbella deserti TaxID=1926257 RepID=A0ABV6QI16_9ACTN